MFFRSFSIVIYNIAISFYWLAILFTYPFNNKSRNWIKGRKNLFPKLMNLEKGSSYKIWMHVASLGEFEQGRPLIEELKLKYPQVKIILSFFSPSGFELRKDYPFADLVTYLPLDTKSNAHKFIEILKPDLAIFIKYDFWFHYFKILEKSNIPLLLVSSIFRKNQSFFKPYGSLLSDLLKIPKHIFVQNEESISLLKSIGITNSSWIHDTRIDRVYQIKQSLNQDKIKQVQLFKGNSNVLIIGSSYQTEETLIHEALSVELKNWKIIIAPHQVNPKRIQEIEQTFQNFKSILWTANPDEKQLIEAQILIIDTIGLLNTLYSLSEIAFIGGGFNKSIHNLLEPAAFGNAILFGSAGYKKFKEAIDLIECKAAFLIEKKESFNSILNDMITNDKFILYGLNSSKYIEENTGGVKMVMSYIQNSNLPINQKK